MKPNIIEEFCDPNHHLVHIYRHFRSGGYHSFRVQEVWNRSKLMADFRSRLLVSETAAMERLEHERDEKLLFRIEKDVFLLFESGGYRIYASSPEIARRWIYDLSKKYRKRQRKTPAIFRILSISNHGVECKEVEAKGKRCLTISDLGMYYGADFAGWDASFTGILRKKNHGVSILRGDPGTGKTSYLRSLIHRLGRTHRFYYIPTSAYPLLSSPAMMDFWMNELSKHSSCGKVIILEDAEELLQQRGSDNRNSVSNLLNIADGLLGEILTAHVICTVNCTLDKLDSALIRPGRLMAYRQFNRLSPEEAFRLALARGISLHAQEDYSLAEIFNQAGSGLQENGCHNRRIGFAPNHPASKLNGITVPIPLPSLLPSAVSAPFQVSSETFSMRRKMTVLRKARYASG